MTRASPVDEAANIVHRIVRGGCDLHMRWLAGHGLEADMQGAGGRLLRFKLTAADSN